MSILNRMNIIEFDTTITVLNYPLFVRKLKRVGFMPIRPFAVNSKSA
jgi:hypothetical protein